MPEELSLDLAYVAQLARLELSAEEQARYSAQLGEVLAYFARLKQVDVEGLEPSAHAHPLENVWGEDRAEPALPPAAALRNAPAVRDGQFVVPKVVDDAS